MSVAGFFLSAVGRKLVLLISVLVAYFGLFTVAFMIDLVLGYNALDATILIGNSEIDLIIPIGLAGAVVAALLYLRLIAWLKRLRRLEEEHIELRLRD